jgi:hypothetical protein
MTCHASSLRLIGLLALLPSAALSRPAHGDIMPNTLCHGSICSPSSPPHLVYDLSPQAPDGLLRLRTTCDGWPPDAQVSDQGVGALRASGSSQFTQAGLQHLQHRLIEQGAITEPSQVTVVDLRREPHGFSGSAAISWHRYKNGLNAELGTEAAAADEQVRLAALRRCEGREQPISWLCKLKSPQAVQVIYQPDQFTVQRVQDEASVVQSQGMHYLRLPMADHTGAPEDAVVQAFITLMAQRGSWLHFHCYKGWGRTGLFIAMLDMWLHANELSLADIARRQVVMGGTNILAHSTLEPHKTDVRRKFVQDFYAYCQSDRRVGWVHWRKLQSAQ